MKEHHTVSHYTLNSGVPTDTITSRCPHCLTITYHDKVIQLNDKTVCCNQACYQWYMCTLFKLIDKAKQWCDDNSIKYKYDGEAILAYMEGTDTL